MSWLGKFLGGTFGFMMGGPLGAILGASLGHQLDMGMGSLEGGVNQGFNPGDQHRVQMAFFTATFSVMGHIAKADGTVSPSEIKLARRVMDEMMLSGELREAAIKLFDQGKASDFPLTEALTQFRKECSRRNNLIRMFLDIQVQAAFADGTLAPEEENVLLKICQILKISRLEFQQIKMQAQAQQRFHQQGQPHSGHSQDNLADAYSVLGVSENASDIEIKKSYRRLMSQNHPDKLVAKGLPEEMMTIAKKKTQKIAKAYDLIREYRKK
ncbi:MAG: co-chaperone DjlA [Methylococcales bacterium]|jgi:DnaJ like chaperone protein|nr:co-chaperone DjlA [Methylococcaceae bacterium]